jgi:hypothetical protein
MEIADFTEEGFIVDFVSFQDLAQSGLELSVILNPLLFFLLHFLQQFLDGGL